MASKARQTCDRLAHQFHAQAQPNLFTFAGESPWGFDVVIGGRTLRTAVRQVSSGVNVMWCTTPLPEITFRRETWVDGVSRATGVYVPPTSGDPSFDGTVFVETDDAPPAVVRQLLAIDTLRDTIRSMVSEGYPVIVGRHGVGTTMAIGDLATFQARLVGLAERIRPAADAAPAVVRRPRGDRTRVQKALGVGIVTLPLLAFLTPFADVAWWIARPDGWAPVVAHDQDAAVRIAVAATVIAGVVAYFAVRGRAKAPLMLLVFWALELVVVPLWVTQGAWFLNAALDRSPIESHPARIESVSNGTVRYRDPEAREFRVRLESSKTVHVGDPLVVRTRAGAFGWTWTYDVVPGPVVGDAARAN